MSEFDIFWTQYPRRENKHAAMREYIHARRLVSAETILTGLANYLDHLPRDRQYIQKPANWLRDGCWENEYDAPVVLPSASDAWFTECQQLHNGQCGGSLRHRTRMVIDSQKRGIA